MKENLIKYFLEIGYTREQAEYYAKLEIQRLAHSSRRVGRRGAQD